MENIIPKPEEFHPQEQAILFSVLSPSLLQQYQPNPLQNNPFFPVPSRGFTHSNVVYNNFVVNNLNNNNNSFSDVYNDIVVNNLNNDNIINDVYSDIVVNDLNDDNNINDVYSDIVVNNLINDNNINDVYSDVVVNNNDIHNNNNNVVHNGTVANDNLKDSVKIDVGISKEHEECLNNFPPGYRFKPFDAELIGYYLTRKVMKLPLPPNKIRSTDIYLHNPEDLIRDLSKNHVGPLENEWYFFTPRKRKYRNGTRPNRRAGEGDNIGYWKATGADKSIEHKGATIGFRKALVFYNGKAPNGLKTNWIMHEYRMNKPPISKMNAEDMRLDDWVLCKLHKKLDKAVRISQDDGEPQLGIVDDKFLLQDDDFFNQYNNGDSCEVMLNPAMLSGHCGYDP